MTDKHRDAESRLVATKLPPGFVLFARVGVGTDPQRFRRFVDSCNDIPAAYAVVRGEDVGLKVAHAPRFMPQPYTGVWCAIYYEKHKPEQER